MSIEAALYQHLLNDVRLTSLRGDRISYDHVVRTNAGLVTLPYQTMQVLEPPVDESEHMTGGDGFLSTRIQINSFGDSAPSASVLNEATRLSISAKFGWMGIGDDRVLVGRMSWRTGISGFEGKQDSSTDGVYAYRADVLCWYKGEAYALAV